ncbi:MAG: MBL fold metallo-hydrolase, partial [Synergistaceae bacterium]|nr:MBL fold metallo-hydrolase [Synergistaceae bacterium]
MTAALLWGFFVAAAAESGSASKSKSPTRHTMDTNAGYIRELPFDDARDAEWAAKGFIADLPHGEERPLRIMKDDGTVIWDMGRYSYIDSNADIRDTGKFPDTVNPSLWRNAILNNRYGLYEVASRNFGGETRSIYQVRGYDVANMSFVETQNGFIVVDVMMYRESAAVAVKLFYDHLPEDKKGKNIHTVIITHSHGDHFGGIDGVLESGKTSGSVTIVAPDNFFEEAQSENVLVGPAMLRRADSMYGHLLWEIDIPQGLGQVNNGLAIATADDGTARLPRPTLVITDNNLKQSFGGTAVEFIMAQNTESPAQMVMFFPDYNSICLAEICNQTQHNVLTPRGAQVRDTKAWNEALGKMKTAWVDNNRDTSELSAWGPHGWPRWGRDAVREYIDKQEGLYRELHDQTVRLMNEGLGMKDIAEVFEFPANLAKEWFNRGYYGATVHNVKAVYQKYLGWFDNNPAKLWELPGKASAELYAKYLRSGGSLLQAAQSAYADGQYRWVTEVLDHIRLVPSHGDHDAALELQADAFEQMAYSAESGIWRNYFLTAAWRNRLFNGSDDEMMLAVHSRQFPSADPSVSKPPTRHTTDSNAEYIRELPFNDTRDRDWADRGFIARVAKGGSEPLSIPGVWDMSRYAYISGDISAPEQFPDTVNPSLWRNAILNNKYGLYEVASLDNGRSIYQVRGYDLANISFVETQNGFIVVDVTSNAESAAAAVKILYDHLPPEKQNKTIHTVIYTHSHHDHYGGIQGVLDSGKTSGSLAIVAPDGFMEEAVSENVTVGPAMHRRALWMYGFILSVIDGIPEGRGQVNNGLAIGSGAGTSSDLSNPAHRPTLVITQDGPRSFDGTEVR